MGTSPLSLNLTQNALHKFCHCNVNDSNPALHTFLLSWENYNACDYHENWFLFKSLDVECRHNISFSQDKSVINECYVRNFKVLNMLYFTKKCSTEIKKSSMSN